MVKEKDKRDINGLVSFITSGDKKGKENKTTNKKKMNQYKKKNKKKHAKQVNEFNIKKGRLKLHLLTNS